MNYVATVANLYWTTSWADAISHTLGGAMLGGVLILLLSTKIVKKVSLSQVLVFALIIGVLWEVFEMYTGMTFVNDAGYWLDTFGDIFFDMFGSCLAYIFLNSK